MSITYYLDKHKSTGLYSWKKIKFKKFPLISRYTGLFLGSCSDLGCDKENTLRSRDGTSLQRINPNHLLSLLLSFIDIDKKKECGFIINKLITSMSIGLLSYDYFIGFN